MCVSIIFFGVLLYTQIAVSSLVSYSGVIATPEGLKPIFRLKTHASPVVCVCLSVCYHQKSVFISVREIIFVPLSHADPI